VVATVPVVATGQTGSCVITINAVPADGQTYFVPTDVFHDLPDSLRRAIENVPPTETSVSGATTEAADPGATAESGAASSPAPADTAASGPAIAGPVPISGGSAATFQESDFTAVVAFLKTYDWNTLVAAAGPFGGLTRATTEHSDTIAFDTFDSSAAIRDGVNAVLESHGLNATGSAIITQVSACWAAGGDESVAQISVQ